MNSFISKSKLGLDFIYRRVIPGIELKRFGMLLSSLQKFIRKYGERFSADDQIHFAKRLAFLLCGGVTLLDSLNIIKKQNKTKAKDKILDRIILDVSNGQFLSTSLKKSRNVFNDSSIQVVRVGENSGHLSQNLGYLADELTKRRDLKRKIQNAMIYPLFISMATLGVTTLLTAYIFPKLLPIFRGVNIELPIFTRILIYLSGFIHDYFLWIGLLIILIISVFWIIFKKSEKISFSLSKLILYFPIVNKIIKSYALANFCRTMGTLLKSGIKIDEAVLIAGETSQNKVYKAEIKKFVKKVAGGERISKCLSENPFIFPDITVQMIAVGETSGNLGDSMIYLSDLHTEEVDEATRNLSSAIEPMLMIVMGIIVGFVAISIITPIYEITENLGKISR